ncbi:hypothetical protein C1646_772283 [Rhizophagus diaphanus]|nr:hypothetical protein C1646_772283 [Rhizophagus diaphanus] [Rhizophagus sp. MUCL 43196]
MAKLLGLTKKQVEVLIPIRPTGKHEEGRDTVDKITQEIVDNDFLPKKIKEISNNLASSASNPVARSSRLTLLRKKLCNHEAYYFKKEATKIPHITTESNKIQAYQHIFDEDEGFECSEHYYLEKVQEKLKKCDISSSPSKKNLGMQTLDTLFRRNETSTSLPLPQSLQLQFPTSSSSFSEIQNLPLLTEENKGDYIARCIQKWGVHFIQMGKLLIYRQEKHTKLESLLDDQDFKEECLTWLQQQKPESHTPGNLKMYIEGTGYKYDERKKGVYYDGHERPDVVKYRKEWLERMFEYQKFMKNFDGEMMDIVSEPYLKQEEKELVQPTFEQFVSYQDAFIVLIKKRLDFNRHSVGSKRLSISVFPENVFVYLFQNEPSFRYNSALQKYHCIFKGEAGEGRLKQILNYEYWNCRQNPKTKTIGYILFVNSEEIYEVSFSWAQNELVENN